MLLQKQLLKYNIKVEYSGNKIMLKSQEDDWFITKFKNKLILFHKNRIENTQDKDKNYHKQKVFYRYQDVINHIVSHDEAKRQRKNLKRLYNMVENNNAPQWKIS